MKSLIAWCLATACAVGLNAQTVTSTFVSRSGSVAPAVRTALDRGPRDPQEAVSGMLMLHRPEENEAAFEGYVRDLSDRSSRHYHHWLTLEQIGSMFGPQPGDVELVSTWLKSQGLTVRSVSPDRMTVHFSGTVAQSQAAFHVSIRNLLIAGKPHFSAVSDPEVPAQLAGIVDHVFALNDLYPQRHRSRVQPEGVGPSQSGTAEYLAPADLATIYDYRPLFAAGITGKGVTIAILEVNDQDDLADWQAFRKVFGLSRLYPSGSLSEVHPAGAYPCGDPGKIQGGAAIEEAIDVDAATASAPNATLLSASCQGRNGLSGAITALANLIQSPNPPTVASLSYGGDEPDQAATGMASFYNMIFMEAAARNISIFASSGDEGAGAFRGVTQYGLRTNANATSPYVTAVGATDTGVQALGQNHTDYFSSTNLAFYGTARSYLPEIPWNASCASSIRARLNGRGITGVNSLCNTEASLGVDATGGGPSSCATGLPSERQVVSGTCRGYDKPEWQSLVGVPADGVRDIPDVSIFGSNNVYGLAFRICDSAAKSCAGDPSTWEMGSGTSISAPIWAGIQALINQATGSAWGLANPQLYRLARSAYGTGGDPTCNSSLGRDVGASCVFHDITLGDNTVPCTGTRNCYNDGGNYGVLSTSTTSLQPAYTAQTGYDFTSGIGTPDVTNLIRAWVAAFPASPLQDIN